MSGHSHASNVKHKKEKNSALKSKKFLTLLENLRNMYLKKIPLDRIFSIAREFSFPKDKVIKMIEKERNFLTSHYQNIRSIWLKEVVNNQQRYNLLVYLDVIFDSFKVSSIKEKFSSLGFQEIQYHSIFKYFSQGYSVEINRNCTHHFLFAFLSKPLLNAEDLISFEEVSEKSSRILFEQREARDSFLKKVSIDSNYFNYFPTYFPIPFTFLNFEQLGIDRDFSSSFKLLFDFLLENGEKLVISTNFKLIFDKKR